VQYNLFTWAVTEDGAAKVEDKKMTGGGRWRMTKKPALRKRQRTRVKKEEFHGKQFKIF
jgi:hypothetical protein